MNKWIYSFDRDIKDLDNPAKLIGNKGVSLSLMTSLGLPVPEGFTITTDINHYYQKNNAFPEDFKEELLGNIKIVEKLSKSILVHPKIHFYFLFDQGLRDLCRECWILF
jgi:pyruvate,orthophosphate dikinase